MSAEHNCRPPGMPLTYTSNSPRFNGKAYVCECGREWVRSGQGYTPLAPGGLREQETTR